MISGETAEVTEKTKTLPETVTAEAQASHNAPVVMKKLSDTAAEAMVEALSKEERAKEEQATAVYAAEPADRDITALEIPDNSEEKEEFKRQVLIATAIVCAALAAVGGLFSALKYRFLLSREKFTLPIRRFKKWLYGE